MKKPSGPDPAGPPAQPFTAGRFVVATLVRAVALLVAVALVIWFMNLGEGAVGANIGAGLSAFAALLAISAVWALFDGQHWASIGRTLCVWAVVAVVVSLVLPLHAIVFGDGSLTAKDALGELLSSAPFFFGLVFVPAAACGALGAATRGSRAAQPTE